MNFRDEWRDVLRTGEIGLQDGEFIAAEAGNQVVRPAVFYSRPTAALSRISPAECPSVSFTSLK